MNTVDAVGFILHLGLAITLLGLGLAIAFGVWDVGGCDRYAVPVLFAGSVYSAANAERLTRGKR